MTQPKAALSQDQMIDLVGFSVETILDNLAEAYAAATAELRPEFPQMADGIDFAASIAHGIREQVRSGITANVAERMKS